MSHFNHLPGLPEYLAGRADPGSAGEIEEHLGSCDACRQEARNLASLGETLRGRGHLPVEDIVAQASGRAAGESTAGVEEHLRGCASCRDEVALLQREFPEKVGRVRAARTGGGRLRLAAAAVVAVSVGLAGFWVGMRMEPPAQAVPSVTLSPDRRGGAGGAVLHGRGPWVLDVLLPLEAPSGDYRMRIEDQDGKPVLELEGRLTDVERQGLTLWIPRLPAPGEYHLFLYPEPGATGGPYRYVFGVQGPAEDASGTRD